MYFTLNQPSNVSLKSISLFLNKGHVKSVSVLLLFNSSAEGNDAHRERLIISKSTIDTLLYSYSCMLAMEKQDFI